MKVLSYTITGSRRAIRPITRTYYNHDWRTGNRCVGWWKFVIWWGLTRHCEYCDIENGLYDICDDCHEERFCECGRELETPGDGLCRRCD